MNLHEDWGEMVYLESENREEEDREDDLGELKSLGSLGGAWGILESLSLVTERWRSREWRK